MANELDGSSTEADTPFSVTSGRSATTRERWTAFLDLWVLSPFRIMWDDWRTRVGSLIILLYLFAGTVGVVIIPEPVQNEGGAFVPPFQNLQFPLGTDGYGTGMFELLVHATPPMLKMILAGALFTTVVATILGTVAGYKAGVVDRLLRGVMDVALALPGLPLVVVVAVAIEPRDPFLVGLILSINAWAGLGRAIRSQVLAIREESYVEASKILGDSTHNIILKDILPGIMPYILISFMQSARNVVFSSVGLYYLGLLPFTTLNWGVMMNQARQRGGMYSLDAAHWLILPMVAIALLTLGLILFAQGMDRVFNPRVRARHAKTTEEAGIEERGN